MNNNGITPINKLQVLTTIIYNFFLGYFAYQKRMSEDKEMQTFSSSFEHRKKHYDFNIFLHT